MMKSYCDVRSLSLSANRLLRLFIVCIALALTFTALSASAAPCPSSTANPSVTICTPSNNATVGSPVNIIAGTTDSNSVKLMQIYVDGVKAYQVSAAELNASLAMSTGTHRLTVQAQDSTGAIFKQTIYINVSSGGSSAPCTLSAVNPSLTICTPANNATVTSPVHVVAGTTDSNSVTLMKIYLDGTAVYSTAASTLDTNVSMSSGTHRLAVQAWDSAGQVFKSVVYVTVGSTPPLPTGGITNLEHIIFMIQENRSQDNYFGRMVQYRQDRGFMDPYDSLPLNVAPLDRAGHPVQPYHFETVCHENLSPGWNESHYDVNGGKMDNFMKTTGSIPSTIDPDGTRAMGYYDWTDLPYYYELAFQFATSDRFFASVLAPTIPNRMYLFAATSFGHIRPDAAPSGGWTQPTIFDALDKAGVSWRYYYQDNSVYLAEWQTWAKDSGKVYNISNWYSDVNNESTLPKVIFIERAGKLGLDEHPTNNIQKGAASVKKILDALMQSPSWASAAFIWSFDEGGGLYDHVNPPAVVKPDGIAPMLRSTDRPGDFNQMGFRVPLIVVSPWAKPHYVSHTPMELTSILRLIEKRFAVPSLTARDANAPDMTEFFDFSNPAWLTPPALPNQPTDGLCSFNAEKAPGH
ncbi:MAG TPA: alkaline phosphatase family protein [Clostridia bacterium]|nr:alkaline phosphatase family protein [Clostridia bacterium]